MAADLIAVEVAYALPDEQVIIAIRVRAGSSIADAVDRSGILDQFPDIDLSVQKLGVFGQVRDLHDVLQAGDRVEIYRPLIVDPKEARKARAAKGKKA